MSDNTKPLSMLLEEAQQRDFQWLLGQRSATRRLTVAPDLAPVEIIEIVRHLPANWLMVVADELVGIIGLTRTRGSELRLVTVSQHLAIGRDLPPPPSQH